MVEVFKTSVVKPEESEYLIKLLLALYPGAEINFDLEDCDRILRVNFQNTCPLAITRLLKAEGYSCEALN